MPTRGNIYTQRAHVEPDAEVAFLSFSMKGRPTKRVRAEACLQADGKDVPRDTLQLDGKPANLL